MYSALISYDGTSYFGWQNNNAGPSIQGALEKALFQVTQEKTTPEAASRTDRGVHAKGQVVQFALQKPVDPDKLLRALNAHLPSDIRILKLSLKDFHPTVDATGKEYLYKLCLTAVQEPHKRLYSWHYFRPLNFQRIERAKSKLIGTHDFSAFSNQKEKNPICTIHSIDFDGTYRIRGDRFLYKMVRNIVGTLTYIGCGKLPDQCIEEILESKSRKIAGVTAPAHGLYLNEVFY